MELLLIVDVQNGFINKHSRHVVKPLAAMAASGRFELIALSRFINTPESPISRQLDWYAMYSGREVEIVDELRDLEGMVFDKSVYSVVSPEFLQFVADRDVDTVYIAGIDTDACVLKSALDIFEAGLRTRVMEDLCASSDGRSYHECALSILRRNIGSSSVINSDSILPDQGEWRVA